MNKILLIIQREYWTRVRKRTFLLMTFLTPLLFGALFTLPIIFAIGFEKEKIVMVLDETNEVFTRVKPQGKILFSPAPTKNLAEAKKLLDNEKYYALVYIPMQKEWENLKGVQLHSQKGISFDIEGNIKKGLIEAIENYKMKLAGLKQEDLDKIRAKLNMESFKASGEKSSSGTLFIFGLMGAMVIYFAIFFYGSQVMRGVVEEKTSRIIEVIISTVKPVQLMLGKIIGVGLVGITQFLLWIVLTFAITTFVTPMLMKNVNQKEVQRVLKEQKQNNPSQEAVDKATAEMQNSTLNTIMNQVNIPAYIGIFLFYFIFGYLMYAALFAAAASAVDNESEMQQFVMPITIPLILSIAMWNVIAREPDGVVAFWMSIFPLTSPVTMLIRYPYGVPVWQLGMSMFVLVVGFWATTWLAARIYRVGILMYGKKVNYKELWKWIFYK
jgi:ABC-2 type transport system permease protein